MVNWTLLSLATNPAAQEKLADELRRELGGGDITEAAVKGRNALPFLNAVVRETHRLRPSIPLSVVKAVSEDTEIHGYNIPAGTRVWLDSYSIQNDPALIPDHDVFRPERWLPEEEEARKVCTYSSLNAHDEMQSLSPKTFFLSLSFYVSRKAPH